MITLFYVSLEMPRVYKPVVGITKHKKYSETALKNALAAISTKQCSQRKAAFEYKIPQSTISNILCQKHPRQPGGQTTFTEEEEIVFAKNIATLGDWGFPVDILEIRMLISSYLCERGLQVLKFKNNIPGKEWVFGFLKRHRDILSNRMCRNISNRRSSLSHATINDYFHQLELTLIDIPPENIINFDETNLSDDPGQKLCIFRRGCKYPERIINSSKSSTSVMFACSAKGDMLHPYVVYKAEHLHDRWIEGGPLHARYNRSRSGWFDQSCFADWFDTVVIPYLRRLEGKKVVIGDNLSSHFSRSVIEKCVAMDVSFVCLPPNSTHICQPLDVSVFASLKKSWRQVLTDWKMNEGRRFSLLPKQWFPRLLARLLDVIEPTRKTNVINGFRKCGIVPLDKTAVAGRLQFSPTETLQESGAVINAVSNAVLNKLEIIHQTLNTTTVKFRKKRINTVPGKSISLHDFQQVSSCDTDEADEELVSQNESECPSPPPLKQRIAMAKQRSEACSFNMFRHEAEQGQETTCVSMDKRTRCGRSSVLPYRFL
jgi:hypothetical protein